LRGIGSIAAGLPQNIHKDSEEPNLLAKRQRNVIFMTETNNSLHNCTNLLLPLYIHSDTGPKKHPKKETSLSQIKL
jgi:hypothetical protein